MTKAGKTTRLRHPKSRTTEQEQQLLFTTKLQPKCSDIEYKNKN